MKIRLASVWFSVLFLGAPLAFATAPSIVLHQVDLTLDGVADLHSPWGSADLTFIGQSTLLYFNLTINGVWQVQNAPILSVEGSGVTQTMTLSFPLGVADGTVVTSVQYGFSLTSGVGSAPSSTAMGAVTPRVVHIDSGLQGEKLARANPSPLICNLPAVPPAPFNFGVPNQEVGPGECVPGAVSNSLQFLRARGLGLKANDVTIANMKIATGWKPKIAPGNWPMLKDQFMQNNKLPVSTEDTDGLPNAAAFLQAIDGLNQHCDVELEGTGHVAVVTGLVPLMGGDYGIIVKHDTQQGVPGGTKTELVCYRANTSKLLGGFGFDGGNFTRFVIECPIPPLCRVNFGAFGPGTFSAELESAGLGLVSIADPVHDNALVTIPFFPFDTKTPVTVTGSRIDSTKPARVTLVATDTAGNTTTCDPVLTLVVRDPGQPVLQALPGIPQEEGLVSVANDDPGIKQLNVVVNGVLFRMLGLKGGEQRTLDVSSAMQAGDANVIQIGATGRPGGTATVAIHD